MGRADRSGRWLIVAMGICLAGMNCAFYLALDRLPISLVAAIEFVGTIGIAVYGLRTRRNLAALTLAVIGVFTLIDVTWSSDPVGLLWAFLNGALFIVYILLGHRMAQTGAGNGIQRLGAAMAVALIVVLPIGFKQAVAAFSDPLLVMAGIGVGVCSSVIPYVCDQLAMARLKRSTFALMLALLPAVATLVGALLLAQIPNGQDMLGIALVMLGVALHKQPKD